MRQPKAFERWLKQIQRERTERLTDLELGGIYVFGYEPPKKVRKLFGPHDVLPLLILIKASGSMLLGINVRKIPYRTTRIRILERYLEALESDNEQDKHKVLRDLSRTVQRSDPMKNAYYPYQWQHIQTKVNKVSTDDLKYLIENVL